MIELTNKKLLNAADDGRDKPHGENHNENEFLRRQRPVFQQQPADGQHAQECRGHDVHGKGEVEVALVHPMFNAQNRIRQLMAERGWTIYRLAQESGLSQTTISNIFKRNNQPSLPTVNAICDACGITLAQFFTENDTANSPNAKSELDNSVAALKEDQREALAAFIKTIV